MRLFVKKSDLVSIAVFIYEKDEQIMATFVKSEVPKKQKFEEVNFTFRRPSYQDSTDITTKSRLQIYQGEESSIDASSITLFQNLIFRTLISDWDIKDESGKKIPVTEENINSLEPLIARAAISGLLTKIQI